MTTHFDIGTLKTLITQEIHVSQWISVSQTEIDAFGRVTRDCDPMHMDPVFARANSPFGQTVLFGFQTLSMLSYLAAPLRVQHAAGERGYDLNYGFNRVRFIAPVPVDTLFRNRVVLKDLEQREDGSYLLTTTNTIEVLGNDRPALVAEWIGLLARESAPKVT